MTSNYSSDELIAPTWMDNKFFEEVLRKSQHSHEISVTNVEITPATAKGDHYASIMFRAVVTYSSPTETKSKSMIIKTMPHEEGFKQDLLKESFVFETEIGMFSKTIPQFQEELRKIGDTTVLGVKALYWSLEPHKVIILEDISPQGYTVLRDRMANMEETKAAFLKLAKWHAISYKLCKEGDKDVCSYRENFFNKKDIESLPFMTTGIRNFIDKLETLDELKKYVPYLKNIEKDLLKKCIASATSYRAQSPEGIFVLGHGDFHAKNIMVKRNESEELEDVMLVDFQMCSFTPATIDLMHGIYLMCEPKLRLYHFEELVYFYCSNFIETLKRLNFQGDIPKVSDFYVEIYRHRHLELYLLSSFLPMIYGMYSANIESLDKILESEEDRKLLYDFSEYLDDLKMVLPSMFHRGYLE